MTNPHEEELKELTGVDGIPKAFVKKFMRETTWGQTRSDSNPWKNQIIPSPTIAQITPTLLRDLKPGDLFAMVDPLQWNDPAIYLFLKIPEGHEGTLLYKIN